MPPNRPKRRVSPDIPKSPAAARTRARREYLDVWIAALLAALTLAVYSPVAHFEFINFDDPAYVSNPHLESGLTPAGISWAFTSGEAANWFPLTRLSELLDHQLFDSRSGFHHEENVALHIIAAILLFAFLKRATGARWPSAFVAFVFALHPLHVESVAWVAERKDVLSACFWFLTLWAYVRYAERPTGGRYALVLVSFCMGLMSKPMLVTLPFVLLLLDIWPLRRIVLDTSPTNERGRRIVALVTEKLPFFVLSGAAAIVTYVVQKRSGAVSTAADITLVQHLANAAISYIVYIAKMFWPTRLAILYPWLAPPPLWQASLAFAVLLAISIYAVRRLPQQPYFFTGWFWYVGTLVPVIGIVQVGMQTRADRYTYIPMVGLCIMLAWAARDICIRRPKARNVIALLAVAACLCCAVLTAHQLTYWRDSQTVFQRALNVTSNNYVAHNHLGIALKQMPDRLPDALSEFRMAIRLNRDYAEAYENLGNTLGMMRRPAEAIPYFEKAIRLKPSFAEAHYSLGTALSILPGRMSEAIAQLAEGERLQPDPQFQHLLDELRADQSGK